MVEIIRLTDHADWPAIGEDERWIIVDSDSEGRFRGSGYSWKASGEGVGYLSLIEDDGDLDRALAAALEWATKYAVPKIWVVD